LKLATTTKTKVAKVGGELIKHWHSRLTTYPLRLLSIRSTLVKWHIDRFIRTASCEAVWSNKFWNMKIHGWFR